MSRLERTFVGKVAAHLFLSSPLVWVEGDSDLTAYDPLASRYDFYLRPAGGRDECMKLAEAMAGSNHLFVVVMDGDYERLERRRSFHRRAVFLDRHSIENYLCEVAVIRAVVRHYVGRTPGMQRQIRREVHNFVQHLESELRDLVIADVAAVYLEDDDGILPQHIDRLLVRGDDYRIDPRIVNDILSQSAVQRGSHAWNRAEALVEDWEQSGRRLIDLVRGHVVFGGLSRVVTKLIRAQRGRAPIPNSWTRQALLSNPCWNQTNHSDHSNLKRRLLEGVRETRRSASWMGEDED